MALTAEQAIVQSFNDVEDRLRVETTRTDLNEDAVSGSASIPPNAWTPVVSYTPTTTKRVTGFNADIGGILDQNFRVRLVINGVVKIVEALRSIQMGFIPCRLRLPAGQVAEVQVIHGEVTNQTYEGSLNFEDV